jgi:hypothetical protein
MQRYHQGINQTAKRSVTRMSDKTLNTKKENELDPNAKLEKQTLWVFIVVTDLILRWLYISKQDDALSLSDATIF